MSKPQPHPQQAPAYDPDPSLHSGSREGMERLREYQHAHKLEQAFNLGALPAIPLSDSDSPASSHSAWLKAYTDYAEARSPMTPRAFHEAIGLWLVSTTIARRLVLHMPHGDVYPNLWVFIMARSTLYAKTTAFNLASSIARRVVPHTLLPDSSTPEALIEAFSGKDNNDSNDSNGSHGQDRANAGQRGLVLDEASGLLALTGRDYMAGVVELLMRLYDCPPHFDRHTRAQGHVHINGPYLTLLAASTPVMMARYFNDGRMWANGWWPRFGLLLAPDHKPPFRESTPPTPGAEERLADALLALHERLLHPVVPGQPPAALSVALSPAANDAFRAYDLQMRYELHTDALDELLSAALGRAPAQALKIATCLAALDWPSANRAPCIDVAHWQQAEAIATTWVQGAARVRRMAEAQCADARMDRIRTLIIAASNAGEWCTLRDLCRATHFKASQVETLLSELEGAGEIETRTRLSSGRSVLEAHIPREGTVF